MNRARRTAFLVGVSLCIAYSVFYSGAIHAFDQEEGMLLVADSLLRKGWFDVDQHLNVSDASIALLAEQIGPDGHNYLKFGLPTSLAALPLYALAWVFPGIGAVQAAFLLNPLVTALTGALVCATVHRLGYSLRVAALTALMFGLATMAAVYSRFFGSEPLVGLALALALWALVRYPERRHPVDAAWAGFALGLGVATRPATAIVVPLYAWLFFGYWRLEIGDWRLKISNLQYPIAFIASGLLWLVLIVTYNHVRFGSALETGYGANETFSTPIFTGLYGLLFSPGKSLFLYSPVLALVPGGALLGWRRHRAETALILTVVLAYLGLYATWNGWWGGVYWGPRHVAPVIPLLCVLLAPVIAQAGSHRLTRLFVVGLAFVSLAPQALGGLMDFETYEVRINQWARGATFAMIYWPRLSPLLAHLREFRVDDVAWAVPDLDWWFPLLASIALGFALWATWQTAHGRARHPHTLCVAALASAVLLWGVLLARAYTRAPYGPLEGPRAALAVYDAQARAGDVLLSRTGERSLVIMNSSRARRAWFTFDARPELPEDEVDAHLRRVLADARRVWLLTPEVRDLSNPTSLHLEAWLSARAFPLADQVFGPSARLVLFEFPDLTAGYVSADVAFGDSIGLKRFWYGVEQEHVKVALDWTALAAPATHYSVSLQLLDLNGQLAAQVDRWPVNGFSPTGAWQPGEAVVDRYALPVADLPPGVYALWLSVYRPDTLQRLPVAGASGAAQGDSLFLGGVEVGG